MIFGTGGVREVFSAKIPYNFMIENSSQTKSTYIKWYFFSFDIVQIDSRASMVTISNWLFNPMLVLSSNEKLIFCRNQNTGKYS